MEGAKSWQRQMIGFLMTGRWHHPGYGLAAFQQTTRGLCSRRQYRGRD
jgi:hypothetical protein